MTDVAPQGADEELLVEYTGPGGRFSTLDDEGGYNHYVVGQPAPMPRSVYERLRNDPAHAEHRWAVHEPEAAPPAAPSAPSTASTATPPKGDTTGE